jgi:hypothetical protein
MTKYQIVEHAKDGPELNLIRIIQIYEKIFNVTCLSILCQTRQDAHQAMTCSYVSAI